MKFLGHAIGTDTDGYLHQLDVNPLGVAQKLREAAKAAESETT